MAHYTRKALGDQSAKPRYVNFTYDSPEQLMADQKANQVGENATGRKVIGEKPVAFKLLNVCKKCNGGWMERLEYAVGRLIPGLIEGETKSLDPYDQLVLSMWIMKTCIGYDAVQEESFIPNDVGSRRLYMNGFPLLYSVVQIGHIPDIKLDGEILHGRDTTRLNTNPDCPAVSVGFRFGHFEIFVSFNMPTAEALASGHIIDGTGLAENSYHVEIWPPKSGRIEWPSEASKVSRQATDAGSEIRNASFKSQK
jgi:hypothetical protein